MINKKWKVEFHEEGTSWTYENLTYENASSKVDNCPSEYMALLTPMENQVGGNYGIYN